MRYTTLLIFSGLVVTGCNLLKNTRTENQSAYQQLAREKDMRVQEQKDWLSRSAGVSFIKDTGYLNYAIRIWPKGIFSYSQEKGFSGEADSVLIDGAAARSRVWSDLQASEQQDKGKTTISLSQKDKAVTDLKEKIKTDSPPWKWILTGLTVVLVMGWILWKRIFKS